MSHKNDRNPMSYRVSAKMETAMRHIQEFGSNTLYAERRSRTLLSEVISQTISDLTVPCPGIDQKYWSNKANNINIAANKIDMLLIHPGETFSFWHTVGKTTKRKGYLESSMISDNHVVLGVGGGLCMFVNALNRLVRLSPLEVTEAHFQSDALVPDQGERVPLMTGTMINYNFRDFRFTNPTHQVYQLHVYCLNDMLYCELRCEDSIKNGYRIVEKDHHFRKEGDSYFRVSKIYRETFDKETDEVLQSELILDNHSRVMYDYDLIPKDQIKDN
ncbi:MAG: VanW family protein [Ruminococcus sp.]|nr:VanW family protein [Ruminococcus sp.]